MSDLGYRRSLFQQRAGLSFDELRSGRLQSLPLGDLGMIDEDGFVYIRGRLKDMIVSGGQNVHSAEVEETLLAMPGIGDCAVFGLPDELWGERIAALIVRGKAGGAELSAESVAAFCRERLAGFKVPRAIHFDEAPLPRTPTGKAQKFLLVERFGRSGG